MNKILISIQPKWVNKIINREKSVEFRKDIPKCKLPCEVYIYCTKTPTCLLATQSITHTNKKTTIFDTHILNGKVVAKFILNRTLGPLELYCEPRPTKVQEPMTCENRPTCLTYNDLVKYVKDKPFYAWYIDNLEVFDKPKELAEFGIERAPQLWCYIEQL